MNNQDRAAKARDKAFRRAERQIESKDLLATPEDYGWDIIWDRALRYADKWWDKQLEEVRDHLEKARGEAVLLSLDLNQAREAANIQTDEVARLRIENDRLKDQIKNQMALLGGSREAAARLRKERDELKVAMVEMADKVHSESFTEVLERNKVQAATIEELRLRLDTRDKANQQQAGIIEAQRHTTRNRTNEITRLRDELAFLRDELKDTKAQLERTRKHTTSATWKVFEENERLVAEVHRLTSLLADEEERVSQRDDKIRTLEALNESLKVFNEDCMRKRDGQLKILAEEKGLTSTLRVENKHLGDEVRRLASIIADAEEKAVPRPRATLTQSLPCNAVSGQHQCTNRMFYEQPHPQNHLCHCGHFWA